MKIMVNDRGFELGEFRDVRDIRCSIQQSPAILSDDCSVAPGSTGLLLGNDYYRMHLNREMASELRDLITLWLNTGHLTETNGG